VITIKMKMKMKQSFLSCDLDYGNHDQGDQTDRDGPAENSHPTYAIHGHLHETPQSLLCLMPTFSPRPKPQPMLIPKRLPEIGPSWGGGSSDHLWARPKGLARRIPSSGSIPLLHRAGDASVSGGGTIGPC